MYARELMVWLHERLAATENFDQTIKRFESLRGYGLLPKGRENAAVRLSDEQIASAVLGFGHSVPSYAGHASLVLGDLRPVGVEQSSFHLKSRLQDAIASLIRGDKYGCDLKRLTLTLSRDFGDDEYGAIIRYRNKDHHLVTAYISKYAYTLLNSGAEQNYDHDTLRSMVASEFSLGEKFFRDLSRSVGISRQLDRPFETDWGEYLSEEEKANLSRKLGARPSSNFLNLRVESQVVWPKYPTRIQFGKNYMVLFPMTKEYSHSVSIDLQSEHLSPRMARSLINQMLSVMSWCDNQPASVHEGYSGSPVPEPMLQKSGAFITTPVWCFNRAPVDDDILKQCLAYYRDGLNALSVGLASHAVLSFFRVIETRNDKKAKAIRWINEHIGEIDTQEDVGFKFYEDDRNAAGLDDGNYIYKWCRVATAHAAHDAPSDPDASEETQRLLNAADVIRCLARTFILEEFGYSDSYLSD